MRPWALRRSVEPTTEYLANNNRTMLLGLERADNARPSGNRAEGGGKRRVGTRLVTSRTSEELLDCVYRDAVDNRCHPGLDAKAHRNDRAHRNDSRERSHDRASATTPRC